MPLYEFQNKIYTEYGCHNMQYSEKKYSLLKLNLSITLKKNLSLVGGSATGTYQPKCLETGGLVLVQGLVFLLQVSEMFKILNSLKSQYLGCHRLM